MDINSLYFFLELSKDLSFTRTARRLYISQQTLSNHILRLEESYGTLLLNRHPKASLTPAGEEVLKFAQSVRKQSRNLDDILGDMQKEERGSIKFGGSGIRLNSCLPHILPDFSKRYPNVDIRITDSISYGLEPLILEGELDYALILDHHEMSSCISESLMDETIYLLVTDELLRKYYGEDAEKIKKNAIHGAYVTNFQKLPFFILNNRMGQKIKECFDFAQITPRAYMSGTRIELGMLICFKGLAAGFATQTQLADEINNIPEDLNIFPLAYNGDLMKQNLSLIHHKDRYLPKYSRYFARLLLDYFSDLEQIRIMRMV